MLIWIPILLLTLYGIYDTIGKPIIRNENIAQIEPRNFMGDVLPSIVIVLIYSFVLYIIVGLKEVPKKQGG